MKTNGITTKRSAFGIGAAIALSIVFMIIFGGAMTDSTTIQASLSDENMRFEMMLNMDFMTSADYTFEDAVDRAPIKNAVDLAPYKNAVDRAPIKNAVDRAPIKNAVDRAPIKNAVDHAPFENAIDRRS